MVKLALAIIIAALFGEAPPDANSNAVEPDPKPRVVLPDESAYQPSPADGGGSVSVHPKRVTASKPCTLTFDYVAGEKGVAIGGGVLCQVTRFWHWSPPQNLWPEQPGYVTATCSNAKVELTVEANSGEHVAVARVGGAPLEPGDRIRFVYGDTSKGEFPQATGRADRFAERGERFYFKVDGDGDGFFTAIAEQPQFDVVAGDAVRLIAFGPSRVAVGEVVEYRVSALDPANNLAEAFSGRIDVEFDAPALSGPESIEIKPQDRGSTALQLTALQPAIEQVKFIDAAGKLLHAISNTMVIREPGPERYELFWGDLQIHGNLSDGTGSPDDIHRYARDVARLDVCALTEHDYWGYQPLSADAAGWERVLDSVDRYHRDGEFVAFHAYEWTNWTFGHQHVLFARREDARIWAWNDPQSDHPEKLWQRLAGVDCVTIPHHCGGGPIPTCWKYHDPKFVPVAELVSVHGISEYAGQPGGIYSPEPSGMVQSALTRGYQLGFVGSGDTHDGHPGIGTPGMPPPGLAGIYATELTRPAILEAIRARRCYATNGCRPILRFHSGATPMGSVIRVSEADVPRDLTITVVGDAPIGNVAVVKNNEVAASIEGTGLLFSETWRDDSPAKTGDYYYARITQIDGGQAWSSPIWVEVTQTEPRP